MNNTIFINKIPKFLVRAPRLTTSFISQQSLLLHTSNINMTKALVLGAYKGAEKTSPVTFTPIAQSLNSTVGGKLNELVKKFGPNKDNKCKTFYGLHDEYPVICVTNLGSPDAKYNEQEDIDEKRENIRTAIANGAKAVRDEEGITEVHVDTCGDGEASAEGALLALWNYDELKADKYKKKVVKVEPYPECDQASKDAFAKGSKVVAAQNLCRKFADTPSNLLTPSIFAKSVQELFANVPNTKVIVRDQKWAEEKKMCSFLAVAKGSIEPPKFLEIHFNNKPDSKPFVLVGKGICFDSGGISIKPSSNMDKMRYDMSGAANVITTTYALATTQSKVNVIALAPLCENMPSGSATKPGDVVFAMNGKSIQCDNTDAEGRMILADGLCYAHEFDPSAILDIATLTGAIRVGLGVTATAVFTHSKPLWKQIQKSGVHTGDRVWRMPLWKFYTSQVTNSKLADLNNIGKTGLGGASNAAAFLSEFVTCPNWMHLDMAGVMDGQEDTAYYNAPMSGRPMRTLYHFVNEYFKTN